MRTKLMILAALSAVLVQPVSASPPIPKVTISAPSQVLIGGQFDFTVTFESDPPSTIPPTVGFAPFIDLVWDFGGADHNNPPPSGGGPCDGIKILSAEIVDVNGGPLVLLPQNSAATCGGTASLAHPFGGSPLGPVAVPMSAQMSTFSLPFGSFVSNQPKVTVKFRAQVHNFADAGHPLFIYARAGFRYGNDALNNAGSGDPPILSDTGLTASGWAAQATVTPGAFIVNKSCTAIENETATGPNYPRQCEITVDAAPGQTITDLVVTDCLSSNMQYLSIAPVTTPGYTVLATPAPCLKLKYPSVTGGAGPEIKVVFNYYVPLNDSNGPVLDPNSCDNATSVDDAIAEGDWLALDPRDTPSQHLTSNLSQAAIEDKRITIQKSVHVMPVPGGPIRPGKLLRWTIDVNVSDYFTVGDLSINDLVADGQDLLLSTTFFPTLTVRDRRKAPPTNVPLAVGQTITSGPNLTDLCGKVKGGTTVMFKISLAMQLNPGPFWGEPVLQAGILTGGHAFLPASNTPASAKIVFYTRVRDTFLYPQTPGDKFVDKDDPINNCVEGGGTIYTNDPVMPQPVAVPPNGLSLLCGDKSNASVVLPGDVLEKTVYAVKRGTAVVCGPGGPPCFNPPNPPQQARPGDKVTFRLRKPAIPSSDAENLTVEDWLPLPVLDVGDPDGNLTLGPPWAHTNLPLSGAIQNPGTSHLLPSDTLHPLVGASVPSLTTDLPTNSIKFDYGSFNDPNNAPRAMDLVFTTTVTPQPFADGLFLTNVSRECEDNTFGTPFCQVAVAPVNVRQPNVRIQKGVVATNNPNGLFTPALSPGKWQPFGAACPRFNPPITSTILPGLIGSNLSNVDANDWATFAIAVENAGGAPAYDIELADIIPANTSGSQACLPSCFLPDYSGLCVRRGDGLVIPFTTAPGAGGTTIIKLLSPLPPGPPTNLPGTNLVIITFNAQLLSTVLPGCCDNIAELTHYASQPGGPNFVSAGFTPPFTDAASICVNPIPVKSVVSTSEKHTKPQLSTVPQTPANTPGVTLGEIVRYRLATAIPEGGMLANFQLADALPAGMQFMNDATARLAFVSTGGTGLTQSLGALFNMSGNQPLAPTQAVPASAISVGPGAACGAPVTFTLGNIQNTENDPDQEYVVIEFNALVCNVPGNHASPPTTTLSNTFSVSINGAQVATSNPINVLVVEPHLDVQKTYTPPHPAMPANFTVTLTNTGSADAFDVHLTDVLPPGLTLALSPPPSVTVFPSGCAVPALSVSTTAGVSTLTVNVPRIPASPSCKVTLKFWVQGPFCGTNKAQLSYSSLPGGANSHPSAPVGTQLNATGSITPCLPANTQQDCERIYTDAAQVTDTANCPPCASVPPGMVAWWSLNETNGTAVINDIAGFNNQGVPKTGSPLGASNAPAAIPGRVAGAINFNSPLQQSGPHVEVADHPEINFGTGPFSIDAWVFVPQPPAVYVHPIVDKLARNPAGTQGTGYALLLLSATGGGSRLQLTLGDGGPLANYVSPTVSVVPYGSWAHIAVTVSRSPGVVTFYINGTALPAMTAPTLPTATTTNTLPLLIGESRGPGHQAAIALDEIEMFNRVLQANEIASIFNAGPSGKCKCVVATNEVITCDPNGILSYTLTLTNISGFAATGITFSPTTSNVNLTPASMPIPPLAPGASTTVTVTISGSGATLGSSICFLVGLTGTPADVCQVKQCLTLACPPPGCATQPLGMVSWWRLNDANGAASVIDGKGGQHGTPMVSNAPGAVTNAVPGKVGGAFDFGNIVNVPNSPSLTLGTSNLSIDAWVASTQPQLARGIVDKLDIAANKGYAFYVEHSSQKLKFVVGDGTALTTYTSTGVVSSIATSLVWHHVAVTVDRSTKAGIFYIDGSPAGTFLLAMAPTLDISSTSDLILGGSRLSFPGIPCVCEFQLDEIEIFNAVVSGSDIQAIFAAQETGKCP